MRRRRLLAIITAELIGLFGCPPRLIITTDPTTNPSNTSESTDGLVPIASSGGGATLMASGVLTRDSFVLRSLTIVGSALAPRLAAPDQFRATLEGAQGRELGVVRMWSPLNQSEWNESQQHEITRTLERRQLTIPIAASMDLEYVVLSWADGKVLARLSVRQVIRDFCAKAAGNPACRPRAH